MRVAIVTFLSGAGGGGSASVADMLASSLAAGGDDVILVTTKPGKGVEVEEQDNIKTYRFRPVNLYWVGHKDRYSVLVRSLWQLADTWNWQVYRVMRRILLQEKPDVVHVHKLRGLSPSVFSAARSVGVKTIIHTLHDHELISPEGTLQGKVGKWARERAWPLKPYQMIRRRAVQHVHCVTAPSFYLLNTVMEMGFFPKTIGRVVENSHGFRNQDLQRIKQRELLSAPGAARREIRLLYLGRLERTKGIELLCEAFAGAWKINPNLRLDVVGDGPRADLVLPYEDHPAIEVHGGVYDERKEALLAACDFVIVPSICPENAPLALLEAYVYGKPCIGAEIGGIPELVKHDRTGYLVEPNNVEALVRAMLFVANSTDRTNELRMYCFEQAERHTIEAVTHAYRRLYFPDSLHI